MFSDGEQFVLKEIQELSTADGFVEVNMCLAEMIKYVANEPSVGLFYIQQHARNATPNLISLENNVSERSREMTLHTEDLEDSISTIRSMRECGYPIADEMIRDITTSLAIMSTKHPKKGLINSSASAFQMGRNMSWGPGVWGRNSILSQQDGEKASSYLSNVIKSAKFTASNLKWPRVESSKESRETNDETQMSYHDPSLSDASASASSRMPEAEAVESPVSSQVAQLAQEVPVDRSMLGDDDLLFLANKYEEYKADREAKLEEWLGEMKNQAND